MPKKKYAGDKSSVNTFNIILKAFANMHANFSNAQGFNYTIIWIFNGRECSEDLKSQKLIVVEAWN